MAEGRKAISKAMRQQVYDSLNGHCGYCGCKITIKEMQVDHIEAVYLHEKELKAGKVPEINSIENYMPACRAFRQPQKRKKRTTLTEYSQNGQKAILKPHVTVNQAAKKLYDYEQTGLSPHEVANLVEQVQNLTRRVKKYESWEE